MHLDSARTIGNLIFGDTATGTAGAWTLDNNGTVGNILTLDGGTPTITVNALGAGKGVTNSAVIAGNVGLTQTGVGTLTLNGAAVNTFTGGLTLNGGTLLADFVNLGSTPNLVDSGNTLALGGGILTIKGKGATYTCAQTLGNVTVNGGGGRILGNNNGGTTNIITLGSLTATAAGGTLLVGTAAANTTGLTITTTSATDANGIYGGRVVWFNGTANVGYDWATTASGASPYILSGLPAGSYVPMVAGATSDTTNAITGTLTLTGAHTHNSLKLTGGATLALGANLLTLTSGGLLSTGTVGSTISGTMAATRLTAGNGSGAYDLIIHQFNSGGLTLGPNQATAAVIGNNGVNPVSLTKAGSGQLTIWGTNTYTGGTMINAGTLYVRGDSGATLGASPVNVTIQSGATLQGERFNFTGSLTLNGGTWYENNGFGGSVTGPVTLNANSFFQSSYNQTINGNVSGPGGFTKTGNNTLTLNGTNTYTGATIINAGTVAFPWPKALYNSNTVSWTAANIIVASGAKLQLKVGLAGSFTDPAAVGLLLTNLTQSINNNGLKSGATLVFDTGNNNATVFNFSTAINNSTGTGGGTLNFQKIGQGTLTLSGANTYTGTTSLNGVNTTIVKVGVASVPGVSGALGNNSAVTFAQNNNQLDLNGFDLQIGSLTTSGAQAGSKLILGVNTLTVGADNTSPAAFSGVISGVGGNLTKIGTGTLTLTGVNTYTGVTTNKGGVINLGIAETNNVSGPLGKSLYINPGNIVMGGGTLQYTAANQYDYSGRFSTAPNQAYNVDVPATYIVAWSNALTSSGGTLTKTNAGTLTLCGASTYSGATTNRGGLLKAGVASVPGVSSAFGNNSAVTLSNTVGVAMDITGFDTQIGSLTGGGTSGGNVTNTGATLTIGGDNTSPAAYAGVISGTGGNLTKIGTGTLTLNNTNTYFGTTTISSGALPNTAGIALAAGATCDVSLVTSPFTLGAGSSLSASGTDLTTGAATLKGPAGGTIDLNSRPMTLNFTPTSTNGDATHPALVIAQGNLTASGVVITLTNNASPLDEGTYTLITNVTGTITGTPSLAGGVGGQGIVSGLSASIELSGDSQAVNLVVSGGAVPTTTTLARHAGTGDTTTYGDTLLFDVTVSAGGGTVTLYDNGATGTAIGSGTLAGGSNTITATLNALTNGVHTNIVAVYAGDSGHLTSTSDALSPAQTVGPKTLTVTGAAGNNKLYDGTAAATFTGALNGVVTGDTAIEVYLIGTGTFTNGGAVGTGVTITPAATLGGTKATSYALTQPTGVTGDILSTAVWTNLVSGLFWSTAGNWTNNLIATGADVTADFNTLNIIADTTVQLDSPRTIGSLTFGDTATGSAGSWTLDNNGNAANTLTLAGTNAPKITVNALGAGKSVTIVPALSLATNATIDAAASGPVSLSSSISGAGGLTKNGAGQLTLSVANTYGGETVINSGTLNLIPAGNAGLGAGAVTLNGGAAIIFAGAGPNVTNNATFNGGTLNANNGFGAAWSGAITLNSNTTVNTPFNMSFGGSISGAGGFTKTGGATMTLFGVNSFTGGMAISGGTLTIGGAGKLGNGAYAANITNNAAFTYSSTAAQTLSGVISGTGSLTKDGTNTLTLSGASTFTGPTAVNAGTLQVASLNRVSGGTPTSNLGAPTTVANGTISLGSGATAATLLYTGTNETSDRVINLAGTTGGAVLDQSSTNGLLKFTSAFTATTNGIKTLTLQGSAAGTGEIGGAIVDSSGGATALTKAGTGTWILSGANSYTGKTTVSGGTLLVNGLIGTGAVTVASGATLGGIGAIGGNVTYSNGASALFTNGPSLTIAGSLTLNGNTVHLNLPDALAAGSYTLATYNTTGSSGAFALVPVIDSGSLVLGGSASIATGSGSVTLTVTAGGCPVIGLLPPTLPNGTTLASYSQTITAVGGVAPYTNTVIAGSVPSGLTLTEAGVLSGTPDAFGIYNFSVQAEDANGCTGTNDYTVQIFEPTIFSWTNSASGNWSVAANWTNDLTYLGLVAAPPAAGQTNYVLNFNKAGTYAATHNLSNGFLLNQLNFGGPTLTLAGNSLAFTNSGATLPQINQNSASGVTISNALSVGANTTLGGTGNGQVTLRGVISGAGSLTKTNSGQLTLWGTNTYTGGTMINAGTLYVRGDSGATLGASPVNATIQSGATLQGERFNFTGSLTLNGGTWWENNGFGGSVTGPVTLNANSFFQSSYNQTINGNVSGPGGFTKTGGNTLTLNGTNTYTGVTTISAGTLTIGGAGQLGSGNYATNIVNNTTFTYNSTATQTLSGAISGTGALTKAGTNTLTLSGASTFTGPTAVNAGTLRVASLNRVSGGTPTSNLGAPTNVANGTISLGSGATAATLLYTGTGETSDRVLNLAGTTGGAVLDQSGASGLLKFTSALTATTNGVKTLTLQGTGTGEFGGAIVNSSGGATALAKAGTGTWILSGANNHTGTTTVTSGKLLVNGLIGTGAVTVASGATLGGIGAIGGNVTYSNGALALLTNGAPLTIGGALTLNNNTAHLNLPDELAAGTYTLATYNTAGSSGAFSLVPVVDSGSVVSGGSAWIGTGSGNVILHVLNPGECPVIEVSPPTLPNGTTLASYTQTITAAGGAAPYTNTVIAGSLPSGLTLTEAGVLSGTPDTLGTYNFSVQAQDANGCSGTNAYTVQILVPTIFSWTNSASGNWSGAANWTNDLTYLGLVAAPPAAGQTNYVLNFNKAGTYAATHNLSNGFLLNRLNFGGPTLTLAGNSLAFTNSGATLPQINQNSASGVTITNNLALGANTTFGGTGNGQVTLQGLISGAGSLTKNGSGTLEIDCLTNTYGGGTIINSGTVYLPTSGTEFGRLGTGPVTLNNATLSLQRGSGTNALTLNGGTIISGNGFGASWNSLVILNSNTTINAQYNMSFGGSISGGGGFTKTGGNTLTLSGINTWTGGLTNSSGTFRIGGAGQLGGGNYAADIVNNATFTYNSTAAQILSGGISGTGALNQAGPGKLTLSGANSYTGTTTVSAGTLLANGANSGSGAVTVNSGATLGGTGAIGGNVTYSTGALALFTNGAPLTIAGSLTVNGNTVHLNLPVNLAAGIYTLATYNDAGSSGAFAVLPVIDSGSLGPDGSAAITTGSGNVILTVTAPATTTFKFR